jgi:hypothetical protein
MKRYLVLLIGVVFLLIITIIFVTKSNNERPIADRPVADEPSMGGKNAKDQEEAEAVASFIKKSYMSFGPNQTAFTLYCRGGFLSSHIHIYGITKHSDQDFIVNSVKAELPMRGWKQVYILFFERENFIRSGIIQKRADEKKLYAVVIR